MNETCTDPATIAIWVSMADHFLDTESRPDLPLTALSCVEAGLSAAEARAVWEHDVAPAVGLNLLSFAGEWAGWDHDWLVARIEQVRARWWNRPGPWRRTNERHSSERPQNNFVRLAPSLSTSERVAKFVHQYNRKERQILIQRPDPGFIGADAHLNLIRCDQEPGEM